MPNFQVPAVMMLPADPEEISAALEGLIARDLRYLRHNPQTPHPYVAGLAGCIRYHFEMPGAEWWSIPEVLSHRWGDCKDLAAWLVAFHRLAHGEILRADGVRFPRALVIDTGTPGQLHALVEYVCGCREDPSIVLGMKVPPGGAPWMIRNSTR